MRQTFDPMEVYPWARLMVRMCARACVISQLTGMSQLDTRNLWRDVVGGSSPSGQQPNDIMWYLKTPQRRSHAALLVLLHHRASQVMPGFAAYPHAYYHYARITACPSQSSLWIESGDPAFRTHERDYVIPFSRGYFLIHIYNDERMHNGQRKCELEIRRCRKCSGKYMAHVSEAAQVCAVCSKDVI